MKPIHNIGYNLYKPKSDTDLMSYVYNHQMCFIIVKKISSDLIEHIDEETDLFLGFIRNPIINFLDSLDE